MDDYPHPITALLSFDCERGQVKRLYDEFRTTLKRIASVSSAKMPNLGQADVPFLSDSNRHVFTCNDGAQDHDVSWLHGSHGRSILGVRQFGADLPPTEITLHGNMEGDPSSPASPPERNLSCRDAVARMHRLGALLAAMLAGRTSGDMPDETIDPVMEEALRLTKAAAASRSARTGRPAYARCAGPFSKPGLFDEKPVLSVLRPAEYVLVSDATGIEARFMDQPRTVNAIICDHGRTDIAPVSAYVDASKTDPMELLRMMEEGSR